MENIDSNYIYQPNQGFSLGMFTTIQQVGFDMKAKYKLSNEEATQVSCVLKYHLEESVSAKLGLELGYGKFALGYGIEIGPKNAYKRQTLGLNLLGKNWGLHFNFFNVSNKFTSSIAIGNKDDLDFFTDEITAAEPARLGYLFLDGYYVFNNRQFAYPATYKAGLIQRKSAGSWMVTGRYMEGFLHNSPEADHESYFMLSGFHSLQVAVGGGYSYNFVCWHRDPVELRDKGLRNLTLNLTLMPVLSLFNTLETASYEFDEEGNDIGNKLSRLFCFPSPNFISSSAISLTIDRFFISTEFAYNWFYFHSAHAMNPNNFSISTDVEDLTFHGSFHNWNLKLLFTYKF